MKREKEETVSILNADRSIARVTARRIINQFSFLHVQALSGNFIRIEPTMKTNIMLLHSLTNAFLYIEVV